MINPKPLIIIFGEESSFKQNLYEKLKQKSNQNHLVSLVCPTKLEQGEQLFIMSPPDFQSFDDIVSMYQRIFTFSADFNFRIAQLVFCLNKKSDTESKLLRYFDKLTFYQNTGCNKMCTFFINNFDKKKGEQFNLSKPQQKKASFLFLDENDFSTELDKWFASHKKDFLTYYILSFGNQCLQNYPKTIDDISSNLANVWSQEIQNKSSDLGQFLNFVEENYSKHVIYDEMLKLKNISAANTLQHYSYVLNFAIQFSYQIRQHLQVFSKSCTQENFRNNCSNCSKCRRVFCLNYQIEFVVQPQIQVSSNYLDLKHDLSNQCPYCRNRLSFYTEFDTFIIKAIVAKCVSFAFNIFQDRQKEINNEVNKNESIADLQLDQMKSNDTIAATKIENENQIANQINCIEQVESAKEVQRYPNSTEALEKNDSQIFQVINAILLSCENEGQASVFNKLNSKKKNESTQSPFFERSAIILDKFCVINSPCFAFENDEEERISIFKDYLSNNQIHFIFLFVEFQRTPIMKERINFMLRKLLNVDRQKVSVVVTKWQLHQVQDSEEELQIRQFLKVKNICDLILIDEQDGFDQISKQFNQCLTKIPISCLSFEGTVFAKETEDELQQENVLEQQLNVFSKQVEDQEKRSLIKQQLLLQSEIFELENKLMQKKSDFYNIQNQLWRIEQEENRKQYQNQNQKKNRTSRKKNN